MCTLLAISILASRLGFGSLFFAAYIFFVTLHLWFLITLITVTPGGRQTHGCFGKLRQTSRPSPGRAARWPDPRPQRQPRAAQPLLWDWGGRSIGPVRVFISEPSFPIHVWRFLYQRSLKRWLPVPLQPGSRFALTRGNSSSS